MKIKMQTFSSAKTDVTLSPVNTRHRTRKGAPGIVEVALRAGVSAATVSRYFNSPDVVKPPTRAAIRKAAEELGYIRDRTAGAMHSRFSGTFGLVVPTINHAIFSEMIEAFANRLQVHDRTMLIASHNYDLQLELSIIRSLLERRIDGVALVGHDHADASIDMLKVRDLPVIALWGNQNSDELPFIGADNQLAAEMITRHLLELGHTDIAFLFPDTAHNDRARDRKSGALAMMQDHQISVPPTRIIDCPYDIASAKSIAGHLINNDKPTAIVCGNDIIAHGVIYAAQECRLSLPSDLSVAGIGDFAGSAEICPGLTTVRIPANRIGQMAADTLVAMCSHSDSLPFINQTVSTQLVIRGSTAAQL
jgi:LacI family transcriptional regulator